MSKLLRVVLPAVACAFVVVLAVSTGSAQQAAPQPLAEMPYSPSLDVTSLDRGVDPCVNFYEFSCGGWKKLNPIPADQASWSVYAKLANENQQFLWGILEQDAKATDRTPIQQKVGDYFESCMNKAAIDAEGDRPIQPALERIDGLKTRPELLAAIAQLHHDDPGSFFFRSSTGQDAVDSSVVIVELGAGGLGLPDRDYYLKTDAKSVKLREQYAGYIAQLLTLSGEPAAQAHAEAASIVHIETELARASLTRVQERDPHNLYHMMAIADVEKLAPAIHWGDYFQQQGAAGLAKLNVSQPEFLKALQAELVDRGCGCAAGVSALPSAQRHGSVPGGAVRAGVLRVLFDDAARGAADASAVEDLHAGGGSEPGRGAGAGVCASDVQRRDEGEDGADDAADRGGDAA